MGLFRLLTFILVVIIAWRMIKNYQISAGKRGKNLEKAKILDREKMVKCEYCSTHIPEEEAINDEKYWFCTSEHRESFKQQNS